MQRGFGPISLLISLLISLAIVAALTGVMLQGYFGASMDPLARDGAAESVPPDQPAWLAEAHALLARSMSALTLCAQRKTIAGVGGNVKGLSASLFATPQGAVTRCEASGDAPPSSPVSGQGC